MNNTNPFVPQGSSLWEQQKIKARARLRVVVFCTLSISIVGLMAMLIQGCRRPADETMTQETNNVPPQFDAPTNGAVADTGMPTNNLPPSEMPAVVPTAQDYTVMTGDTLSGIAKKFGFTSYKPIQDANPGIEPTKLRPGQKLHIPPLPVPAPAVATTATGTAPGGEEMYTVKSGDTLSGIATAKHTTVKALRAENNLTTDRIIVGQKLKIPKAATPAPDDDPLNLFGTPDYLDPASRCR